MEAGSSDVAGESAGWHRPLLLYGVLLLGVVAFAIVAIWALFEKRRLDGAIRPLPLPQITFVTTEPDSEETEAWISFLSDASFSSRVVEPSELSSSDSLTVIGPLDDATSAELLRVSSFVSESSAGTIITGEVPEALEEKLGVGTETIEGTTMFSPAPAASPILARVAVEHQFRHSGASVPVLNETPDMEVDARWDGSSRAAVAHWKSAAERFVWLGFSPSTLNNPADAQLKILMRTAARWAARQPVSDGALLPESGAPTFVPAARAAAQSGGLAFSVEATEWPGVYSVRIWNRTDVAIENPAVAVWLPDGGEREVSLWGSPILSRFAEVIPQNDYHVVHLRSLNPRGERLLALEVE